MPMENVLKISAIINRNWHLGVFVFCVKMVSILLNLVPLPARHVQTKSAQTSNTTAKAASAPATLATRMPSLQSEAIVKSALLATTSSNLDHSKVLHVQIRNARNMSMLIRRINVHMINVRVISICLRMGLVDNAKAQKVL